MTTTALVVEILVAGLLAMAWLLVVPVTVLFPEEARNLTEGLKGLSGYSLLLGAIVLAAAYTLGWLVNGVTYLIARVTYRKFLQRQIIGRNCTDDLYEKLRTTVLLEKSCEEIIKKLNTQTSVHRIARAGGLNFMAFGAIVLALGESSAAISLGAGLLVLGLAFWWVAIDWHREYMSLVRHSVAHIATGKKLLDSAGERSRSFPAKWCEHVMSWMQSTSPKTTQIPIGDVGEAPQAQRADAASSEGQ